MIWSMVPTFIPFLMALIGYVFGMSVLKVRESEKQSEVACCRELYATGVIDLPTFSARVESALKDEYRMPR